MRPDTQITTWSPTHWIWGKITRSLWEGFGEFRFRIRFRGMGPRIVIWEVIESNKVIFTFSFGQWPLEETWEGRGGCNLQPDEVSTLSLHLNNTRWLPIVRESLAVPVWPMASRTFPSSLLRQSCSKISLIPFAGAGCPRTRFSPTVPSCPMDKVHNLSQLNVSGYPMALPRHSKVERDNSIEVEEEGKESSGRPLLPSLWWGWTRYITRWQLCAKPCPAPGVPSSPPVLTLH